MAMDLAERIRDIPDFPQKGIIFKDITPLLQDAKAFRETVDRLAAPFRGKPIDLVVGMESRGFIFGAPLAYQLGAGFVPVRKLGRLPYESIRVEYSLEYGTNVLEIHRDAIGQGDKVLVVDDLLATGGTVEATIELVQRLGGDVVGVAFVVELTFLDGRTKLAGHEVVSLIKY